MTAKNHNQECKVFNTRQPLHVFQDNIYKLLSTESQSKMIDRLSLNSCCEVKTKRQILKPEGFVV